MLGNFWTRPSLSKEQLIKKLEKQEKRFGLVWDEERNVENINGFPMLSECIKKEIKSEGTPNILIEGDNYHALSILNYTHKGKIDVIYIDPPYNLGKEFIYNDKLVDKEDGYRHSKWLSFMKKRLVLAKNLLSKKGVIFISIDDNEQAQLRMLCDDTFGEDNFIANIIWHKKYSPQNDAKYFSDMHDFILVYVKRKKENGWKINLLPRTEEMDARYKNEDGDTRGPWKSSGLDVKTYQKEYDFPITTPSDRIVNPPKDRSWRCSPKRFKELAADNRIWFGKRGNNVPSVKKFLSEVKPGFTPVTVWSHKDVGHTQSATQELKRMGLSFSNPKPVKLIKRILQIASKENSIVLDFFAGSGTTGHAVLQLNKEDGGNRQFILCTNNENNICSDVCYPRLKKVIKGYNSKGEKVDGLGGGGSNITIPPF